MAVLMGARSNRVRFDVDNPVDSDGFYRYIRFKTHVRALKGGRTRRRVIRSREAREWRSALRRGEV